MATFSSGNLATISYNGTDFSDLTNAIDLDAKRKTMELERCGGNSVAKLTGAVSSMYKWKLWFDPTVWAALNAELAAATPTTKALIVSAPGSGSTETSAVFVSKVQRKSSADKPNEIEVELEVDGDVTYS